MILSRSCRRKARKRGVGYTFVFMRADGAQLQEITSLIESGVIKLVVDRFYPFESTAEALAYVEQGGSKGKVTIEVK
ncbi:zinc-binding dehydrogenase [Xanthomonas hortorum]|uniref:Zinc-binding dehydrogenase n=2 Tax=Xanthomonas hortorum TaxID=56454 RepID=A0A9X4H800_9XANT|nr:zinc-binding dehydrogenase [Xanthomonas hortorum]MDC8640720.1 zinc-binding dehydrogenase [Xanthomonas hortorum pv. hederae]PPU72180.1 hypothetical protein XhhCFBP4925_22570 [Xanthomonas hortorum pv. hederae]